MSELEWLVTAAVSVVTLFVVTGVTALRDDEAEPTGFLAVLAILTLVAAGVVTVGTFGFVLILGMALGGLCGAIILVVVAYYLRMLLLKLV